MASSNGQPRHLPVLLDEVIELLQPAAGQSFIDCTVGAGGHSAAIAERIAPDGSLVMIDRDENELSAALGRVASRPVVVRPMACRFSEALANLRDEEFKADGILLDLGISSMQIDEPERGFSYMKEGPLDMRMDRRQTLTASQVINTYSEPELARIFWEYGEESWGKAVAASVARQRRTEPIESGAQLVRAIDAAIPRGARKGHNAKRVFQALRIEVNDEVGELKRALDIILDILKTGARLAVISFHSLEDKLVKSFIRKNSQCSCPDGLPVCVCNPVLRSLTRGAVKAGEAELAVNRRAASARLRAALVIA